MLTLKKIIFILILICNCYLSYAQKDNYFANIANYKGHRSQELIQPLPPQLPNKFLNTKQNDPEAAFTPLNKVDTKEELLELLHLQKERMRGYLQNYAPEIMNQRIRTYLTNFKWRIEKKDDLKNFGHVLSGGGQWEDIKIPHYGPPRGEVATYYYTNFDISKKQIDLGSLFLNFKGVDYKAQVYVNGFMVGTHEGTFAPFEFEFTNVVVQGKNNLLIRVENDHIMQGSPDENGVVRSGDKVYAVTSPGYDDPQWGWHHSGDGMGIWQDVYLEARPEQHISDVFIRTTSLKGEMEIITEINNCSLQDKTVILEYSVFGQNFRDTSIYHKRHYPQTVHIPGIGDLVKPTDWEHKSLQMGKGINLIKFSTLIESPKIWCPDSPWMYQIQIRLLNRNGQLIDVVKQPFGIRTFTQDTLNPPKGMYYLNGNPIRLRGTNTMGFLQRDVMGKNFEQLTEDILLAKICNINFIRLTQRPVQDEVYDYCDMLGMMTQTDLPLFGVLRYNKFTEAVKQAGEMERLVRNHPCNIQVTYINERFPNAEGNPHRCIDNYLDFEKFFTAANQFVHYNNPDRVIKPGDGDYDPPSPGLPDNHCYCGWYNSHGLDLGKLHKGFWQLVKPGWNYACGEFGAEGLDPKKIMDRYYPKKWLPDITVNEKEWNPGWISMAQSFKFHYMWYDTQETINDWIKESQNHQAWIIKLMAEAFRRDNRMVSFAVHLFIDAWPAGWMKAIMDVERNPKKAFFAYRDALQPLLINIRTDRYHFFGKQKMPFEIWICNDSNVAPEACIIKYQLEKNNEVYFSSKEEAQISPNSSLFQGFLKFVAPKVDKRETITLRVGLFDQYDNELSESSIDIDIFPLINNQKTPKISIIGSNNAKAHQLCRELNFETSKNTSPDIFLINDFNAYKKDEDKILARIKSGATALFFELTEGKHLIAGDTIICEKCTMGDYHFVSRNTNHPIVREFKPHDFKFWYQPDSGFICPIMSYMLKNNENWDNILVSGNTGWGGRSKSTSAAMEKKVGNGIIRIVQVKLPGNVRTNPVATIFASKLLNNLSKK